MEFAVIALMGHQYLVEEGDELIVDRMSEKEGNSVEINQVLLAKNKKVRVGTPVLNNITVKAKVLEHFRGDKITVIKFKRKKRYRRKQGFRPDLTRLKIEKIIYGKN